MWPATMILQLNGVLPEPYFAEPGVHLGTLYEVAIATYRGPDPEITSQDSEGTGGAAVATYAPPKPTLTLEPRLPKQDVYEVRIYRGDGRQLVAAIEIVSPSNKDRPETRAIFATKIAELLAHDVCVSIVDVVTNRHFNLYAEVMNFVRGDDPASGEEPSPIYAATLRIRRDGMRRMQDNWYHPLAIGGPLPVLPIWLNETLPISLDLESSYEATCRGLRFR
jgi:hypothetical protein